MISAFRTKPHLIGFVCRIVLVCGIVVSGMVGCGGKKDTKPDASVSSKDSGSESKPKPREVKRIEFGLETTYVVSPLRSDGRPDYLASLEKDNSIVAGAPNAAVNYWNAIGVDREDANRLATVFEKLEVNPPLTARLQDFESFLDASLPQDITETKRDQAAFQLTLARARPWKSADLPIVNAWLESSQPLLDRSELGTWKDEFFSPFVPIKDAELVGSRRQPLLNQMRDLNTLLVASALKVAAIADVETAWHNLDSSYAMIRHVMRGNTYCDYYLANSMQHQALQCETVLAQLFKLSKRQWESRRDTLDGLLENWQERQDQMHQFERFAGLDMIVFAALNTERSADAIDVMTAQIFGVESLEFLIYDNNADVDWNAALREFNSLFDRLKPISKRSLEKQLKLLDGLAAEVRKSLSEAGVKNLDNAMQNDPIKPAFDSLEGSARGQLIARVLFRNALARRKTLVQSKQQTQIGLQAAQVALALSAYAKEHSSYPDKLESIAPDFMASSTLAAFAYRRLGAGYVIEKRVKSMREIVLADRREIDLAAQRMRRLVPRIGVNAQFGGFVEKLDLSGVAKPSDEIRDLVVLASSPEAYLRQLPPSKDASLFLGLRTIQSLDLTKSGVTAADLEQLRLLPALSRIQLSSCAQLADNAAFALSQITGLIQIDLAETQITDKGLAALNQLPTLSRIVLSNTKVTDEGVAALRQRCPNCEIVR